MRDVNWNDITELEDGAEYSAPEPGGYIVKITSVEDREDKEGLLIEYDIARGDWTDYAKNTYDRAGFWPLKCWVSYKDSALRFFKGFKCAVEVSNKGYKFDTHNVQGLVGKFFGVVLGEEEYQKNNGSIGTRLYTAYKRSALAIRDGDFKTPEKKLLNIGTGGNVGFTSAPMTPLTEDDGELPF